MKLNGSVSTIGPMARTAIATSRNRRTRRQGTRIETRCVMGEGGWERRSATASPRAVLAAEDDRFYLHLGFDFEEIGKAIERSQRGGRLRGASTITQQVAKNLFLWEGRSFVRKGAEAYLTLVLELCLSKDRILDLYLNLAEWGDGVFGAEMAARTHFRKSARNLSRIEAARLAAILPAPRRWPVYGSVATRRAEIILSRMAFAAPRDSR